MGQRIQPSPSVPLPSKGEGRLITEPEGGEAYDNSSSSTSLPLQGEENLVTELERGKALNSPSPSGGRGVGERERKSQLLKHAKTLRSNQTDAEQRLWYHLRAKRFNGLKFKRQKPIEPFIADFVCMECKLVVEADGGQHGSVRDQRRDEWFARNGFTVLRFWNNEVLNHTESVLERIRQVVIEPSPPTPLPPEGEGSLVEDEQL